MKYIIRCIKCDSEKEILSSKPLLTGEASDVLCDKCGLNMVKKFVPYAINGNFGNTSKYRAGDK